MVVVSIRFLSIEFFLTKWCWKKKEEKFCNNLADEQLAMVTESQTNRDIELRIRGKDHKADSSLSRQFPMRRNPKQPKMHLWRQAYNSSILASDCPYLKFNKLNWYRVQGLPQLFYQHFFIKEMLWGTSTHEGRVRERNYFPKLIQGCNRGISFSAVRDQFSEFGCLNWHVQEYHVIQLECRLTR